MRILMAVFFEVFWRENSPHLNRCYLQNKWEKIKACVLQAPAFFLSFSAGKVFILNIP